MCGQRQIYLGVLRCPGDVRERGTRGTRSCVGHIANEVSNTWLWYESHHSSVLICPLVLKSIPHVKNGQSTNQINTLCLFLSCTLPHLISVTVFNLHSPILSALLLILSTSRIHPPPQYVHTHTCAHTHIHTQMSLTSKTPIAWFPQSFLFLFWFSRF